LVNPNVSVLTKDFALSPEKASAGRALSGDFRDGGWQPFMDGSVPFHMMERGENAMDAFFSPRGRILDPMISRLVRNNDVALLAVRPLLETHLINMQNELRRNGLDVLLLTSDVSPREFF
jgi:hypothetical protein